jgi:hypothetical protein
MYVKIFRTTCDNVCQDLQNWCFVFNSDVFVITLIDDFQYQSEFLRMRVIFVDQGQLSHPDFISSTHQRENVQCDDKHITVKNKTPVLKILTYIITGRPEDLDIHYP